MPKYFPAIIQTHHVMHMMGLSTTTSERLLRRIRAHYKKTGNRKYVSISEFSNFTGIPLIDIIRSINGSGLA